MTIDNVSGYTLGQIEAALARPSWSFNDWGNNLRQQYTNPTENSLQELVDNW